MRFAKEGRSVLIRELLWLRFGRESIPYFQAGILDHLDAGKISENISDHLAAVFDSELMGTPEATIVISVETYWSRKALTKLTDSEIFQEIENFRFALGAAKGAATSGTDLATFITRIIRSENPECTPENISDETIRALIEVASDSYKTHVLK